jgi:hypothetical protein
MSTQSADETTVRAMVCPPPQVLVPKDVLRAAERLGVAEQLPQVIALSRSLFGDSITLRVTEDPELDDWTHIVVETAVSGAVEEVVAKEANWCDLMVRHGLSHWFNLSTYYG